jgi:hypothetical protein
MLIEAIEALQALAAQPVAERGEKDEWAMTLPLPDFTNFTYILVSPPAYPKGLGWDKLRECERRLAWYRWAERLDEAITPTRHLPQRRYRVILGDCLSAFLMTLEAALQHVGDQLEHCGKIPIHGTAAWLRGLPEHDLQMQGLRTLRHFTAHVEIKPAWVRVDLMLGKPEEDPSIITSQKWLLPELTPADLAKLRTPELTAGDLLAWNTLVIPILLDHRAYKTWNISKNGLCRDG